MGFNLELLAKKKEKNKTIEKLKREETNQEGENKCWSQNGVVEDRIVFLNPHEHPYAECKGRGSNQERG